MSDLRLADVGVGQSSALSPVLSTLFITPIMKLFKLWAIRLGSTLLSYVDDGTAITQSKSLDDNNTVLKQAYTILFVLFAALEYAAYCGTDASLPANVQHQAALAYLIYL